MLSFLALAELLADRQAVTWGVGDSQKPLKQMGGPCTYSPLKILRFSRFASPWKPGQILVTF
jgi:hypothetical protein